MSLKGSISIKDNVTGVLQSIKKEQSSFRKDVESTRKVLQKTWDRKYKAKIENTVASKKIKELSKKLTPLRKKVVTAVAIKDIATAKLKATKNKLKAFGKMSIAPVVRVKNKLSGGISKIKGVLKSISKKIMIPVGIATAGVSASLVKTVQSGFKLENQKISMEHFIGATNKDYSDEKIKAVSDDFVKELRENANKTPFETGEVMQAGSRAIAIAGGNTKEAMELITLAEDMASASGGTKDISQAIEALADAKMGEMERLKEFGFKVSAEEFKNRGFSGVSKDLSDFYGGASEKLAKSGSGLLSTITGKLKSNVSDTGEKIVNNLKPVFEKTIVFIDKVHPHMEAFGEVVASNIGLAIKHIEKLAPSFKVGFNKIKPTIKNIEKFIVPIFETIFDVGASTIEAITPIFSENFEAISEVVLKAEPIISGAFKIFGIIVEALAPVFNKVFKSITKKLGSLTDFVSSKMPFMQSIFESVMPVVAEIFETSWSVMSPIIDLSINVFKKLFSVVEAVFPAIRDTIKGVWEVIKPIIDGIAKGIKTVSDGIGWASEKLSKLDLGGFFNFGSNYRFDGTYTYDPTAFGYNASGSNNWKGGLTWVGEEGAELVDLPKGSRILPNKESVSLLKGKKSSYEMPKINSSTVSTTNQTTITLPKLADTIVVREDADIEKIGKELTTRLKIAKVNFA